jgi:release factor glutamine methyltransferase
MDASSAAITARLREAGCVAPADEAHELTLAAGGDAQALAALVRRRVAGEPLAWVTGRASFCGVGVAVDPGVYVPRPQTEPLAMRAAELLPASGVAVDLCTGSGAIAAVLATAAPGARVLGTELDPVAVRCARGNGVDVREGYLDDPLPADLERSVNVLTAVVPYVPTEEIPLLPRDVREHESRLALDGGPDGTDVLAKVLDRSSRWLRPGGWLLLELGGDQAAPLRKLALAAGFDTAEVMTDEDGLPRAICAQLR